jgi:hypothetical protein
MFSKVEPSEPGAFVALWFRPEFVQPGHLQSIVKRLVMAPPGFVTFPWLDHPENDIQPVILTEMLNPQQQFVVRCNQLLAIHRCLGKLAPDIATARVTDAELRKHHLPDSGESAAMMRRAL